MIVLEIEPGKAPLSLWRRIAAGGIKLGLGEDAWPAIARARQGIEAALASGEAIYGVNTGFGKLAQTRIPPEDLKTLQRNLVLSHSTGVGKPLADDVVRLVLALKIASLARGFSGVRPVVVERLLDLLNKGVLPVIPEKGSVGASGDLAPLAHLSAVLIDEGAQTVLVESADLSRDELHSRDLCNIAFGRSSATRCAAPWRTSISISSIPTSPSPPRCPCTSWVTPLRCATPTGRSTSRCSRSR